MKSLIFRIILFAVLTNSVNAASSLSDTFGAGSNISNTFVLRHLENHELLLKEVKDSDAADTFMISVCGDPKVSGVCYVIIQRSKGADCDIEVNAKLSVDLGQMGCSHGSSNLSLCHFVDKLVDENVAVYRIKNPKYPVCENPYQIVINILVLQKGGTPKRFTFTF